jgi:NDP-sugar pyrophosphorylase family protein
MKAMILAAGKGTRLGEITAEMPKVLVDINGKSLLWLAVEKCSASGFDDIIVNVHHFADKKQYMQFQEESYEYDFHCHKQSIEHCSQITPVIAVFVHQII